MVELRRELGDRVAVFDGGEDLGVTTGVHPAGFAAACLYKAGLEQERWATQTEVAEAGNVTPTTVRTHRDTLAEQVL